MKKKIVQLIKSCDYFGVTFNFHYKTKEKFRSMTGGIIFILFLIISITYVSINLIQFLRRENMNIIWYKTQTPSTYTINFKNYSLIHAFGLKCSGLISGKEYDYFKLFVNHVELTQINGKTNYYKTPINYSLCTKEHFNNQFNDSIDSYGLNQRYCFDDNNITIRGLYSEEIYQFVELTIAMTKTEKEDYETYYDLLTTNDCTFQLYHTDYGIDIHDFNNPVIPYIRQEFLKLSPIEFNKMEIYYLTQEFMSDKNYLFNNYHIKYFAGFSMFSSFSLYKGSDRLLKKPDDYDKLGKFFLRADTGKSIILRKYMKFTEFLANVSSLISQITLILFVIMSKFNKFYSKEKIISNVFQIKDLYKEKNSTFLKKLKENFTTEDSMIQMNYSKKLTTTLPGIQMKNENKFSINPIFKNYLTYKNNNYLKNDVVSDNYFQKSLQRQRSLSSRDDPNYVRFKFNFFEIIIYILCPCFKTHNFQIKSQIFCQGEKLLFLNTDILSYIKNTQILEILTYLLLEPNQLMMIKFLSKHMLSLDNKSLFKNKVTWNAVSDNKICDNEFKDFCKGYKKLQNTIKKTNINQRLYEMLSNEIENLVG